MRFDCVIFDLDGTLLDTLDDLADSCNAALSSMNTPPHPTDAYRTMVGDGIVKLLERALPAGRSSNSDEVTQAVEGMRREYALRWNVKSKPYAGVPELLAALTEQGVPVAIFSNKPDDFAVKCVEALLPGIVFDVVRGKRDGTPAKPAPDGALAVAEELGLSPGRCLYVGDTNTDMRTAVAAGMFPAGVTWGFRDPAELTDAGAQALLHAPDELLPLLA